MSVNCVNYIKISDESSGGFCKINAAGLGIQVSKSYCLHCNKYEGSARGFGDTIHNMVTPIAKAMGHPCIDSQTGHLRIESPCLKKMQAMNKLIPYN
jgi:hypothetical protein